MHETTFSHSHLEHPAPGAVLAAGPVMLHGWVWPKPGGHFVDVRARVGDRIFPGMHGLPRPDLAAHFQARRALAGFRIPVMLPPGPAEIVLETLELEGRWSVFQTVAFQVTVAEPMAPEAAEPLRWHDFCRGLELILRARRTRPGAPWQALAAEIADELPYPQDLLQPQPPYIGHADEPAMVNHCRLGCMPVVGYLFRTEGAISRLWATTDLQGLQPLQLGRATTNLVPHFPLYPAAAAAGYEAMIDVPSQLPNPVSVRIYAESPTGDLELVQVRRTRRHDAELEKLPYVGASEAAFAEALAAWRGALRARGRPVTEDTDYQAALAQLRVSFLCSATPAPVPQRRKPASTAKQKAPSASRILFVSHNLNLEGAPLFLLDLVRQHATRGTKISLLSGSEGVLQAQFAALSADVKILNPEPVFTARSKAEARAAIAALGLAGNFAAADLVITNTFTTFWAVLAAKAAGRPVLHYVHESTTPGAFYRDSLHPEVLDLIEESLTAADLVSFTSEATRRYHDRPERPIQAALTPGWIDLQRLDTWRRANPRTSLRAQLGIGQDQLLVTNIGTVSDRKGQHGFVRAIDLFRRRHPDLAARTRFLLLGGRHSPFDDRLRDLLADLDLPQVAVHPETPDYLPYYAAADLSACSSLEESSPRVVFEAMGCGTPLLASDIAGIREIARDGREAMLVPAGDTSAWAEALARMLLSPGIGRDLAASARGRVEELYDAATVLPRHLALAAAVAASAA